jgi:N-acetyl-anhydromuramyl-L-alanine amidase AmpD
MATQISCNMKSTWHIISVEVESLYLPQFTTLSKYLKIYGYYINGQSSQMKKKNNVEFFGQHFVCSE